MPKNQIKKDEMDNRVLKLKNELYEEFYQYEGKEFHRGAHVMLDKVLNIIQEYRY